MASWSPARSWGATIAALLLAACVERGSLQTEFVWADGEPEELPVYVFLRVEERPEDPRVSVHRTRATAGPARYDGERVELRVEQLLNGEDLVAIVEVRQFPSLDAPITHYGLSEPFRMAPGLRAEVPVLIHATASPRAPPGGGGVRVVTPRGGPAVPSREVRLLLAADRGRSVRLSNHRTFPDDRTQRVELVETATTPVAPGFSAWWVSWDLDFGLSGCPRPGTCEREVFARFVDDFGYESVTSSDRVLLDTEAPRLRPETEIQPRAAGPRTRVRVTLVAGELLRRAPEIEAVGAPELRFDRLLPDPDGPSNTYVYFSRPLGEHRPPDGEYPLRAVLEDLAGNRSEPLEVGVLTLDGVDPDISDLEVSPSRVGPAGVLAVRFRLAEDLPPEGIQVTLGGRPITGCERSGRVPEIRVACTHALTGSEISPGTQATLSVLVTAVDAALNRVTLEAPVVVDFAPPDLRDLAFFPTPARLGTSASLRVAVSERLGRGPELRWASGDPGFEWESGRSTDFEHFFGVRVGAGTPEGAHELVGVVLEDEVGNRREVDASERLLPAVFGVDLTPPRVEAFAVSPARVGLHPGALIDVRFDLVEEGPAGPPRVSVAGTDITAACREESRAGARSSRRCTYAVRGDEVQVGTEAIAGVVVEAVDLAGNTATGGGTLVFDFAPPGLIDVELVPSPAGIQDVVLLRLTATEPLDSGALPLLGWAGASPAFTPVPGSGSAFERSWTLPVSAAMASWTHVLETVELVDTAGNRAVVQGVPGLLPATLEIDTAPPAILQLTVEAPGQPVVTSPPRVGTSSSNRSVVARFSVREASPAGPPRVLVSGRDVSSGCSVVGANQPPLVSWRCAFTASAQDAPSGQETSVPVVVEARDRAGNVGSSAATVVYDLAPPALRAASVTPSPAGLGAQAALRIEASEPLLAAPSLAWSGAAPPFVAQPAGGLSAAHVFHVSVTAALASGSYVLTGVTLRDLAGNVATVSGGSHLPVSWLVDTTPPVVSNVTVTVPGSPVTVPPRVNGAPGRRVEVSFAVFEANPGPAPRVSLGAPIPLLGCSPSGAPPTVQWSCVHTVTGAEIGAGSEEARSVLIEALDAAGNRGSGSGAVVFDFAPPAVLPASVSVTLTASAANPLARVDRVSFGTSVAVQASWSEPLRSAPTVRTLAPERVPLALEASAGTTYRHGYTLTRAAPLRQGVFGLEAVATDLAGNQATVPIPGAAFTVDTVRPPAIDVMTDGRVGIERVPWGSQATAGRPMLTVTGQSQAASGDAAVVLISNPFSLRETGRTEVLSGGAFGPVELDSSDLPTATVEAVDAAGNRSARRTVRNGRWVATLGGKVPGSTYPNPHRLLKVGEARRMRLQAPEGGREEEASAPEILAASLAQGQTVQVLATPSWIQVDESSPGPGARRHHAMAFDPVRGVLVVFGGSHGSGVLGDLWEWDGVRWRERTPSGPGPSARENGVMVYDAAREQILLFGGESGAAVFGDLWRWDGRDWIELSGASMPSARAAAAIGYHPPRGEVVLFGGRSATAHFDDTWIFDGGSWRQHTASGVLNRPAARAAGAMAHAGNMLVLFGGETGATFHGDTWEWDGTRWRLRLGLSPTPPARAGHGMAPDVASGSLVLFGGRFQTSRLGDLWTWNGSAWTQQSPPWGLQDPVGQAAPLVYDARQDQFVSFGGDGQAGSILPDLVAWDRQRWSRPYTPSPGPGPEARNGHILVSDAHGLMLFGGGRGSEPALDLALPRTWVWSGSHWREALNQGASAPTARARASAARFQHSTLGDGVLMFGGRAGSARNNETWFWRRESVGGRWQRLFPSTSPLARDEAAMAYDTRRNQALLFGGRGTNNAVLGDFWIWNGTSWTQRLRGTCPSWPQAMARHAMSYDEAADRTVMVGAPVQSVRQLWEWDGTCWVQRGGSGGPLQAFEISAGFDPGRGRVLIGPGIRVGPTEQLDDRLWASSGAGWFDLSPRVRWLTARAGAAMAHEPSLGRVLLFGGRSSLGDESTTWLLTPGREVTPGLVFDAYWAGADVALEDMRGIRLIARVGGSGERRQGLPPLTIVQPISGVDARVWNPYWATWNWTPPTFHSAPASAPGDLIVNISNPVTARQLMGPDTGYVTFLLTPRGPDYATTRGEIVLDYIEAAVDYCLGCP